MSYIYGAAANASKWQVGFNSAFKGLIVWRNLGPLLKKCIYMHKIQVVILVEVHKHFWSLGGHKLLHCLQHLMKSYISVRSL
jgi:hypothetical protein